MYDVIYSLGSFGLVIYAILAVIVGVFGSDRESGFFGGLLIALLFSPFIGVICVMCTPTKDELNRRRAMYNMLKQLTDKAVLSPGG